MLGAIAAGEASGDADLAEVGVELPLTLVLSPFWGIFGCCPPLEIFVLLSPFWGIFGSCPPLVIFVLLSPFWRIFGCCPPLVLGEGSICAGALLLFLVLDALLLGEDKGQLGEDGGANRAQMKE